MKCQSCLFVIAMLALGAAPARAVDLAERCTEDQIPSAEAANGRNQWALACHLITKVDYDCAVNNGYYWTFNSTTGGPNRAPLRPGLSCAGYRKFTMCPAGCFEARQRLLFDGRYVAPEDAYRAGQTSVTTLAGGARRDALRFTEEEIASYVFGAEQADLFEITADAQTVTVTHNHPMIDGAGNVIAAEDVHVGDTLLTERGPASVRRVARVPFAGTVWNVRPVSAEPRANVLVAEGFLTGSIRYQNEWASDAARLLLRQTLDVEGL